MFTEPIFAMIISDFTNRICILRNERQLASKINPLNFFIAGISLIRLFGQLPDLFTTNLEDTSILVSMEGSTYYESHSETLSAYRLIDLTCIVLSLILLSFLRRWLRANLLTFLWLAKLSLYITLAFLYVSGGINTSISDTITVINIALLYMKVNI